MEKLGVFLQCFVFALLVSNVLAVNITISNSGDNNDDDNSLYVFADEVEILKVCVENAEDISDLTLVAVSKDEDIFRIANDSLRFSVTTNETVEIGILGVFVGIEDIELKLERGGDVIKNGNHVIKVKRQPSILVVIYTWSITAWLLISYITMGCKMDWRIIREKLRRPYGVLIGAFCQFIIMPALSFGLAKLLNLDDAAAIGLVTIGSCPGGWLSNVFSLLLDVDFVLSLTMTFISTILALGFMPLNLFLYASQFTGDNENLKTPFFDIMIQLVTLVIPVFIGMVILYKFPKLADICLKCLKPFAVILLVMGLGLGTPAQLYVYFSDWEIFVAGVSLPFIGGCIGFGIAKIARIELKSSVTISLETGVQNSLLAIAMVRISYPQPESDLINRVPFLVVLFTSLEGTILTIAKVVVQKYFWKSGGEVEEVEIRNKGKHPEMIEIDGKKCITSVSVGIQVGEENSDNDDVSLDNPGFTKD
ncbi:ileal sodium/bile acid cotransporter-like [Antedon mediterranea]|uniref:ileal sodium/bile acid cotransporter-like n=1 Tax=Antedon mediterranea TaxID=105859 RepID=UPI003AF547DE